MGELRNTENEAQDGSLKVPENKSVDQLIEELSQKKFFNITRGFPTSNSQEFFDFVSGLLMKKGVSRIPIVGLKNGNIIALAQSDKPLQHTQLLENLGLTGKEELVEFTASIESVNFSGTPTTEPIVKFSQVVLNENVPYVRIGQGSDVVTLPRIERGRDRLKLLFQKTGIDEQNILNW